MGTVAKPQLQEPVSPRRPWYRYLAGIGPGLVVSLGSLGPRDIVSNSVAGSNAGYSLLWVLLVSLVIRMTMLDASARYTLVTGETLLAGCGRLNPWVVRVWFVVTILRRHAGQLLTLSLLGTAAHMVFPLSTPRSAAVWSLISWIAAFTLVCWGRYPLIDTLSKPLMLLTGGCVALTAILSKPDLGSLASGILHPVLPTDTTFYSPWLVIMGILAATMGSISSIRYSAAVLEKGWRSPAFLRQQRIDLLLSLLGMFTIFALMQIAAAGALQPRGIHVRRLEDIAPIFSTVFGGAGVLLFGATLWCVTFAGSTATDTAYGIMLSDVYYRFVRPSRKVIEEEKPAGSLPAYRLIIAYSFLSPLYVLLTKWSVVSLLYVVLGVNLLMVPVVAMMILRLTSDRTIMGAYVNHRFTNVVLALAVVCALFLAGKGLLDLFKGT